MTRQQWAEKIKAQTSQAIPGFVAIGRALIDAKAELKHGEFTAMVAEDLPFDRQTVNKFMAIASQPAFSNDAHVRHLPVSWGTLATIAKLPEETIVRGIASGELTASTERKQAAAFAKAAKAELAEREALASEPSKPFELTKQSAPVGRLCYGKQEWLALDGRERLSMIEKALDGESSETNKQKGDSIEWARWSLNTVTGCEFNCPYCYARDIAEKRLEYGFVPTFHPRRLSGPGKTDPPSEASEDPSWRNIFANSMSDLFGDWVPSEWIEATIKMAALHPKWRFLVLTKNPARAADFEFPENWWMGATVDVQGRVKPTARAMEKIRCKTKWLSVEPLLEPLDLGDIDVQWLVIGGASSTTNTAKWVAPYEWDARLFVWAKDRRIPVYFKTNSEYTDSKRVREFPWTKYRKAECPPSMRRPKG